jgi:hypothetical protein
LQTVYDGRDRQFLVSFGGDSIPLTTEKRSIHPKVTEAKEKARQSRFEHGEKPGAVYKSNRYG